MWARGLQDERRPLDHDHNVRGQAISGWLTRELAARQRLLCLNFQICSAFSSERTLFGRTGESFRDFLVL